MSEIKQLTRVFRMGAILLPDPDPSMSPEEVVSLYSVNYPHLAHATLSEPRNVEDTLEYQIERPPVKTKGMGAALDMRSGLVGMVRGELVADVEAADVVAVGNFRGFPLVTHTLDGGVHVVVDGLSASVELTDTDLAGARNLSDGEWLLHSGQRLHTYALVAASAAE